MTSADIQIQAKHFELLSATLDVPIVDGADPQRELPYVVIGSIPAATFTGAQGLDGEEIIASVEAFASRKSEAKMLKSKILDTLHHVRPILTGHTITDARYSGSALRDVSEDGRSVYQLSVDIAYTIFNT